MNTANFTASTATGFTPVASVTVSPVTVSPVTDVTNDRRDTYATTESQLEIWLSSQQSIEASCAYNEISSLELHGQLNAQALREAIDNVIQRHASLRSTFSQDGRTVTIHHSVDFEFEMLDWSDRKDMDVQTEQHTIVQHEGSRPFDLTRGPLIRFVLQKLASDHHKLTFTAHHIVMDGWSLAVFCRDLGHFYDELCGKSPTELPPVDQFVDHARAIESYMASEQYESDSSFWSDQFADGLPVLDTPIEFSRPKLKTYRSERYEHHLPEAIVEKLRKVGTQQGCSLFNTILAAFSAYLSRLTGANDICVGIPTAGQAAMNQPELIGCCVNTMPLRTKINTDIPFDQLLKSTRTTLLNALEHQRLSFGTLLRILSPPRDPSRSPIVEISLNLDPVLDLSESGFADLDVTAAVEPRSFENFEWFINGVIHKDKSIELQIQYKADLYSRQAIESYFEGFESFLQQLVSNPTGRISDARLLSIRQRQQVIVDWNQTNLEYPVDSTLHQEFSRQAAMTPDRIAVEFEGRAMTYAQVESRSNQIARFLQSHGVAPGDLVGICVQRSEQMLVNLFAILKAGAGYVPLDPAYPNDRLHYMCDHSGLSLIVTQSNLSERVAEFGKTQLAVDVCDAKIDGHESEPVGVTVNPSDICYVIYTSGSTGKPKGVQVPHGAVVNFLYSMRTEPGFESHDSILAVTTLSFDIAVLELYLPTICGGKVVILDTATAANGEQLANEIQQHDITVLQATPSTWRLLIESEWQGKSDLRILCGGEPMPPDLVAPLLERCSELWNMYGPTETTVWSSVYRITDPRAPILIGKPIGNTQLYLLDQNGIEVPIGCEGELFIGGAGVTLGYRKRPDLTDERFVRNPYRNPFARYVSSRLYRTGDIARFRNDGHLQFLRRNDKQVKVRGFRIEIGEIEQNLKTHPSIQQNVVIVREDTPGDPKLVAYYIAKPGQTPVASDLRAHLRLSLPSYMVPHQFVLLDQMPQTNNGKIDYSQLPKACESTKSELDQQRDHAATPAENYVISICAETLQHDDILLDDTFFDVGGHSLLVMQLIARIENETGIKLGPQDFLVNTIQQLAGKLAGSDMFLNHLPSRDDTDPEGLAESTQPVGSDSETVSNPSDDKSSPGRLIDKLKGFWD